MKQLKLIIILFLVAVLKSFSQDVYLDKGNTYLNNNQFDKAEQTFREAIKSDTSNLIYQCQLGLTLIQAKKYSEGEQVLDNVIKIDPNNEAAIWYSGIGNYYNAKDRQAIIWFEKVLSLIDKNSGQYFSAYWFIGKCYSNLLKTEGLTNSETDRMFECYEEYLSLQPNAEDAKEIKEYVERKKKRRPPSNVKVWLDL